MSSSSEEDLLSKTKMAIGGLLRGKEVATQLKTLLQKPVDDHGSLLLAEELAVEIFRSFNEILSVLNCGGGENERSQIEADDHGGSASSGDSKKNKKDRRGCYKRRKTSDSWTEVSPTMEDGCAWRKYGQKLILNAKYPRSYFRCTLKHQKGCKATKQVQRIEEDPTSYQTTYFGQHTCRDRMRTPHRSIDTDPPESNLLSFEEKVPLVNSIPTIPLKESKEDTAQSDSSDAKSSPDSSLWFHDMKSLEPLMIWSPKIRYFDMEGVGQFGDLDFDF